MAAEDAALARDVLGATGGLNATALSPREVLEVCAARGVGVDGDHEKRVDRLARWLAARATLLSALAGAGDGEAPPSLTLHMPALLSALLEKVEVESFEALA